MTARQPKHRGPYDAHDANLWANGQEPLDNCDRCDTRHKGRYRRREQEAA